MNTLKIEKGNTRMVAHRGVSGIEPENTNFSFVAAGNRTYFGIETDIHRTADGEFILTHDDNAKRVSGVDHVIEETDFATLRALCLFDKDGTTDRTDIHMPTLEEYIRISKRYEKVCVLELKNHMEEADVRRIIDRIEALEYLDRVIFISFDFENLIYVRNYRPSQSVQYLFWEFGDVEWKRIREYRFDVDVHHRALTEEIVKELHGLGVRVNCWTVNQPEIAEKFVSWGVDFITTNILE